MISQNGWERSRLEGSLPCHWKGSFKCLVSHSIRSRICAWRCSNRSDSAELWHAEFISIISSSSECSQELHPPHGMHEDWVCLPMDHWMRRRQLILYSASISGLSDDFVNKGWHHAKHRCDFYDLDICLVCTRLGPHVLSKTLWKDRQMVMNFSHCWLQLDTNKRPKGTRS